MNGDPSSSPLGDGQVNVLDAQQIARSAVGLPVQNPAGLSSRGDVSADGAVNIVDAQQIARFSVALSATARVGAAAVAPPAVASVTVTPATPQTLGIGATLQLNAVVGDAGTADVSPCAEVAWSSSDPGVATVSASGTVTGVAAGTAIVSARSEGKTASVAFTVAASAPPQLQWVSYFTGSSLGGDATPHALVVDQNGNATVAGDISNNYATGTFHSFAVSTDNAGQPRWVYLSDTSTVVTRAVLGGDPGMVFVVGGVRGQFGLVALDASGQVQFTNRCSNITGDWSALPYFTTSRWADRIYIAGVASDSILTADLAGTLDCTHRLDAAAGDVSRARLFQLQPLGTDLLTVGDHSWETAYWYGLTFFVQRNNGASTPVWRTDFGTILSPRLTAGGTYGLATTTEGGEAVSYVTASVIGSGGPASYLTARLDDRGNIQWIDLWNGNNSPRSCEAYPYVAVPDPRGGVIIAGMGSTDCTTAWDAAIASYTPAGVRRWSMKPVFNGNGNNNISAAALSGDGRYLYIMGQTAPTFRERQNVYVAKYALPQ